MNFHWPSGVNDTVKFWLSGAVETTESWLSGVIGVLTLKHLSEFTTNFFENILGCESVAEGEMFDNKKIKVRKSRETVPLVGSWLSYFITSHSDMLKKEWKIELINSKPVSLGGTKHRKTLLLFDRHF
jgi:hypothetical protein